MHLVQIMAHGLSQHGKAMHERVAMHFEQRPFPMPHAPDLKL